MANGIVEKAGAWFSYNNAKIGQGRENSKTFLKENPEIREEICNKVRAKNGIGEDAEVVNEDTGEIEMAAPEEVAAPKKATRKKKTIQ